MTLGIVIRGWEHRYKNSYLKLSGYNLNMSLAAKKSLSWKCNIDVVNCLKDNAFNRNMGLRGMIR